MRYFTIIFILVFSQLKVEAQICVGQQGRVQWDCWRGLFADQFSELTALEFFPNTPDVTRTLYSLNAPYNYDNNFGARISGFIKTTVSDSVLFNVTGDSRVRFYLSTDNTPQNLVMRAQCTSSTNEYEHTKFPSQTSEKLFLDTATYYYFELWYVESTGNDHCKLFWKANFLPNQNWNIITAAYIYDVGCKSEPCVLRGTTCDDGNINTTDDQYDGHCNCIGKPETTNTCVGERGKIDRYRYDNIPGSSLNDLYLSPNFPAVPQYSATMPLLGMKSESLINDMGHLVQGYLSVPVSGLYKFNVTGDDNVIMFISSNHDPVNKQAHQLLVTGWTGMTEHNKYIYQSTSFLQLNAGQYYYVEINHKEGSGSEHFAAFWQTPFTTPGVWKRIPAIYFYAYDCSLACIPEGTLCDDGNPFTNDDQYNNDCECTGTPCSGPDCDSPLANYVPFEKCNVTDQLGNRPENNWLSCEVSDNPNPERERSHWIQYDLGARHELLNSHIWNYNVANETDRGFQSVVLDFSDDGILWNSLGMFNWPLANGETNYGGFMGPDLSGVFARYILITSLDDTTTCRGLGKVVFRAIFCPLEDTECDDQNPMTVNDRYNQHCECIGQNLLVNSCDEELIVLGDSILYSEVFSAVQDVISTSIIDGQSTVGFIGGQAVELNVGFETMPEAVFIASIDPCDEPPSGLNLLEKAEKEINQKLIKQLTEETGLQVVTVPGTDFVDIHYYLEKPTHATLKLKDDAGKTHLISDHDYINKGHYRKRIRTKKLNSGIHMVTLTTDKINLTEKLWVGGQIE